MPFPRKQNKHTQSQQCRILSKQQSDQLLTIRWPACESGLANLLELPSPPRLAGSEFERGARPPAAGNTLRTGGSADGARPPAVPVGRRAPRKSPSSRSV